MAEDTKEFQLKDLTEDEKNRIITAIDAAVTDNWTDVNGKLTDTRIEAYERFFREPFGNERPGFSQFVSGIIQRAILQARAAITAPYVNAKGHIWKFPSDEETLYMGEIAKRIDLKQIVRDATFNGLIAEEMVVRPYSDWQKGQVLYTPLFDTDEDKLEKQYEKWLDLPEQEDIEVLNEVNSEIPMSDFTPEQIEEMMINPELETIWSKRITYRETGLMQVPNAEVINPTDYFFTQYAENDEQAVDRGIFFITSIGALRSCEMFEDAWKINGFDNEDDFWTSLVEDYSAWYRRETKWAQWLDTNTNWNAMTSKSRRSDDHGIGARQVAVCFSESRFDVKDNQTDRLFDIYKVGTKILYMKPIDKRYIQHRSMIDLPNRERGLSFIKLLEHEERSATLQYRMMEDNLILSSHGKDIVDEDQINMDDYLGWSPGQPIRRIQNLFGTKDTPAIEQVITKGPDGTSLNLYEMLQKEASVTAGVGKYFEPYSSEGEANAKLKSATEAMLTENASNLMIDDYAQNVARLVKQVGEILHEIARTDGSPMKINVDGEVMTIDPREFPVTTQCDLDIVATATEAEKRQIRAEKIFARLDQLTNPATANPLIAGIINPKVFEEAIKDLFTSLEMDNVEEAIMPLDMQQYINDMMEQVKQQTQQETLEMARDDAQVRHHVANTLKVETETELMPKQHMTKKEEIAAQIALKKLELEIEKEKNKRSADTDQQEADTEEKAVDHEIETGDNVTGAQ